MMRLSGVSPLHQRLATVVSARACRSGSLMERATEPFPSWLCLAGLQYMDGFGELAGAPGAAAELTEDPPGLELGVHAVSAELTQLSGVSDVTVDLVPGGVSAVTVSSAAPLAEQAVAAALDEAGDYRLAGN